MLELLRGPAQFVQHGLLGMRQGRVEKWLARGGGGGLQGGAGWGEEGGAGWGEEGRATRGGGEGRGL